MVCLIGAKMNMRADLLRQIGPSGNFIEDSDLGWVESQDPDSGEIIRVWSGIPDDPATPTINEAAPITFNCEAKAVMSSAVRSAGVIEFWSDKYEAMDYIQMKVSPKLDISSGDRVTNVRDQNNNLIWKDGRNNNKPTVFSVLGVTPITDPFGQHVESMALLNRAETQ